VKANQHARQKWALPFDLDCFSDIFQFGRQMEHHYPGLEGVEPEPDCKLPRKVAKTAQ
jgi:hypothetical protein